MRRINNLIFNDALSRQISDAENELNPVRHHAPGAGIIQLRRWWAQQLRDETAFRYCGVTEAANFRS